MPEKYSNWLPKFLGDNIILAKEDFTKLTYKLQEYDVEDDHEDVVVKLFSLSLEEDARMWFRVLDDGNIKTCDALAKSFMEQ